MILFQFNKTASAILVFTLSTSVLIACGDVEREPIAKREEVILEKPEFTGSGLGFVTGDQLEFPNVRAAANQSIVKIVIPTGETTPVENLMPDQTLNLEQTYQRIRQQPESILRDLTALEVKRCLAEPTEPCLVRTRFVQASGFFIENGEQIVTTASVVTAAHELMKNFVNLKAPLPVLIYGSLGQRYADETVAVVLKKQISNPTNPTRYSLAILELPMRMGNPLEKAKKFEVGERAFVAGFPIRTNNRKAVEAADSDGSKLYFSQGVSVAAEDAKRVLTAKADNEDGMYGGPIMNELGQYIGVLTSGTTELSNKLSFGISVLGF